MPQPDSLNSCFSEVTGRGHIDAACFPRQQFGQRYTSVNGCTLLSAPLQAAAKLQQQSQIAPRLTKALLEENELLQKLTAPSASPSETPAASEQLCRPARLLQAGDPEAVSAARQRYLCQAGVPSTQQERSAEGDNSDTASETGSSSTPPPRKGRRRTAMCRSTYRKEAATKFQPPPKPAFRPTQPFPWARATTSKLVQKLLAMQAPERCPPEAYPPCKAARLGTRSSPAQQTSCPAALPACPHADLAADLATASGPHVDLAAHLALPACPNTPAVIAPEASFDPLDASNAGSLPSGVAEWRVQVWPAPVNCTYAGGVMPRV